MRAFLVLALAAGVGPARAASSIDQAPLEERAPIEELVRVYRSGLHERAVIAATLWSNERVTLEIRRLIAEDASREEAEGREVRRLAAAAILAESALSRLRDGDLRPLAPGISTASLLLETEEPLGARSRSFAQRFYLLAGLALHWHLEIAAGHGLLAKAIQRFPDDPELHTALGSMIETVASLRSYDVPPGGADAPARSSGGYLSERGGYGGALPGATYGQAQAHYEQALVLDPKLDEARLRLARVRLLMGRAEDALRDLERVVAEARQTRQRYLAWLFAGYGRQRLGDVTGAVAAYRACIAHGPRAQTALLALGRSLDELADEAGAQEAFARASAIDAPFDPWWSYGGGQPERLHDLVEELRGLVR